MIYLTGQAQHIGTRSSQQDYFGFATQDEDFVRHAGVLAVVCDGMGGLAHGDAASRVAVASFISAYEEKSPSEPIPDALKRSAVFANLQVGRLALGLGCPGGVGTTVVAAAVLDAGFYYISVGDSAVFLCSEQRIELLSRPHVFATHLDESARAGRIPLEAAQRHPEREALTSYLGIAELREVDQNLKPYPLQAGDSVLLASDGLFKTLTTPEMQSCLSGFPPVWPRVLVDTALASRRVNQDNVTAISVTLEDESRPLARTVKSKPLVPAGPPPLPKS